MRSDSDHPTVQVRRDSSCSCRVCFPTGFWLHGEVWHIDRQECTDVLSPAFYLTVKMFDCINYKYGFSTSAGTEKLCM